MARYWRYSANRYFFNAGPLLNEDSLGVTFYPVESRLLGSAFTQYKRQFAKPLRLLESERLVIGKETKPCKA